MVAHMDDMTQQNSSMAEESAGVARELQQATEALKNMVGVFRINERARDVSARVVAEIKQIAPHLTRAQRLAVGAPARPLRQASGGQTKGWSEF